MNAVGYAGAILTSTAEGDGVLGLILDDPDNSESVLQQGVGVTDRLQEEFAGVAANSGRRTSASNRRIEGADDALVQVRPRNARSRRQTESWRGTGSGHGGPGSSIEPRGCSRTGPGHARRPERDEKSGVNREAHAPFCGSPGVRSLRTTRHQAPSPPSSLDGPPRSTPNAQPPKPAFAPRPATRR